MIRSSWKGNPGGKKHCKLELLVIIVIKKNVGLNCVDNLLIKQIRKPTRYYTVLVSMSFVIGIEKMIEVTLGIPLQRKIKVYPQKKESLNINPPSYPPIVYVGCGVA